MILGRRKERRVRILNRGDRGFHGYGAPFKDSDGGEIEVYDSSAFGGPYVWLKIDSSSWNKPTPAALANYGVAHAHLNRKQAQDLIARLQTWLDATGRKR